MSNGKGSNRRPSEVDKQTYESNWDRIFSKKDTTEPEGKVEPVNEIETE